MLKSKGYDVTEEKAESLWSAVQNHVLTDEELDQICGGGPNSTIQAERIGSGIIVVSGCSVYN